MLQTRNNPDTGSGANDPIATRLAAIAAKLEAMESLKEDIADLKRQAVNKKRSGGSGSIYEEVESSHSNHNRRLFHKIKFPVFSGGDPRGWRLKAEKYFRFYNTLDEEREIKTSRLDIDPDETAGISLHAILRKPHPTTMKIQEVQVDQEKILAVQSWPIPSNVKQVRGFLGLTGYYRIFMRNYRVIVRPLTVLTKKDGFIWSKEALLAFNTLKQALLTALVLRLPNFSKTFVVECDASSKGVGAILSQDEHPVAYFSRGFSLSNRVKSAYDHIKSGLQTDPFTSDIIQRLLSDQTAVPDFHLVDQFLFCKNCLVIPEVSNIKLKLLQEAHTTPLGGHGGFLKTIKRLNAQYFWPKMKEEVRLFIQQCVVCQQQKYQTLSPAGLLQPLPIPTQIWQDILMDFIVGLRPSCQFDTIFVVVDRLSKYAHFIYLSHPFTAKSVASVFCNLVLELLISWSNRPVKEATWESYDLIKEQFPNFRLEDKSFYQEGNYDTTRLHMYTRKQKRVKTYDPDLNELDQFNAIFGIWLDPLGQEKNEIVEW
ncbi:retrotransposable element Tf2 [Tanacetum coccineum]